MKLIILKFSLIFIFSMVNLFVLNINASEESPENNNSEDIDSLKNELKSLKNKKERVEKTLTFARNSYKDLSDYLAALELPEDISDGLLDVIDEKTETIKIVEENITEINKKLVTAKK